MSKESKAVRVGGEYENAPCGRRLRETLNPNLNLAVRSSREGKRGVVDG